MSTQRAITVPYDLVQRGVGVAEDCARALGASAEAEERSAQREADLRALVREAHAKIADYDAQLQRALAKLDGMAAPLPAPPPRVPTVTELIHGSPKLQTAILTGVLAFLAVSVALARLVGVETNTLMRLLP